MKPLLIVYATREGTTRRVAKHLSDIIGAQGIEVELAEVRELPRWFHPSDYCAVIAAASVHFGKHEREMMDFVLAHRAELELLPTAFVSVSGSEATAEDPRATSEVRKASRAEAEAAAARFVGTTGWHPERIELVAGAILPSQYGFLTRLVIRLIGRKKGVPVDTSRDQELTDWHALGQLANEMVSSLPVRSDHA